MKIIKTNIKDLLIVQQKNNKDVRGSLRETHDKRVMGHDKFVFEYCTTSKKNILRGFHFQTKFMQAKYVSVVKGKILDCVIDLRKKSKTFGKTFKIILSEKNAKSLYIPEGFGHAYYSYEKLNIIYYKLTNYYKPKFEDGIIWNDKKTIHLWPTQKPIVSKKDLILGSFEDFCFKHKSL
jgi:dTDP-4-dehydrorhamnose 3,5-epimerase